MRKIEIDDVEAMIEKTINKDGRVWGLKDWKNKKVLIIVPKESNSND